MIEPDFEAMSRQELRAYVIEHREDKEAFHVYMDKVTSEPGEIYPAPQSINALQYFSELLEKHNQDKKAN